MTDESREGFYSVFGECSRSLTPEALVYLGRNIQRANLKGIDTDFPEEVSSEMIRYGKHMEEIDFFNSPERREDMNYSF